MPVTSHCLQGDLSRKEWVAPALSPLTGDTGGSTGTGSSAGGIRGTISHAVEGAKSYLPPQVFACVRFGKSSKWSLRCVAAPATLE